MQKNLESTMMDLLACAQNKLHDPIVMEWALLRYRHADLRGSDKCCEMERLWFHDLILGRWLDSDDHDILANMFRTLPARLFVNLKQAVLSRWMGWSGSLGSCATPVLAKCAPEEAVPLLGRHIDESAFDLDKTFAVFHCLGDLPPPAAQQLLGKAMLSVARFDDEVIGKTILTQTLLQPASLHNEDYFWELVKICARIAPLEKGRIPQTLRAIYSAWAGSDALMTLAERSFQSDGDFSYSSLAALFGPNAPLEECDSLVRESASWPRAKALLETRSDSSPALAKSAAVCRLFEERAEIDHSVLTSFAVASVLNAYEIDKIAVDSLSLEQTLDLLSLNVPKCRHFEQLAQRLGDFEKQSVAQAISDRLPALADKWGSLHLAKMAGHLRLDATAASLLDCLSSETGDYLCETASDALARLGETAASIVVERWDGLDSSQQIYGRSLLEKIGGETACQFALDRFDELFHEDHQEWCSLIEACPNVRAIRLIEPELRRKQPAIDECYYLLCVLAGEDPAGFEEMRDRVWRLRRQVLDHRTNFEAGNFGALFNTLTLTLRCEKCCDVNRYDVKSLVYGKQASAGAAFVRDDIRCASCGQWADFEFTGEAYMQMSAALLVRAARRKAGSNDADSQELFQLIDVQYRWQTRPAPEVMAELKSAAEKYPDNVVSHLRLGRMQYVFGRRGRAEECYQAALRLEHNSMEAGLGLAQILSDGGQQSEAFDRLCQMLDAKNDWRFFRTDELSPKSLSDEFARLFNKLHGNLRVRHRPLLHATAVESRRKVGRNDPCPCGSGAKYKKCCGNSQSAELH
jgi:tetratricopeptide (TPR) repeat protein